jgi:hypothetical protein
MLFPGLPAHWEKPKLGPEMFESSSLTEGKGFETPAAPKTAKDKMKTCTMPHHQSARTSIG